MRCRITDTIRFKSLGYSRYDQFMRNRSMYAETAIAQLVFMHKQSKKLFAAIERKALPKILKDIMYIMRKGWADRLSVEDFGGKRYDFSHCHLLAEFGTVISGGKKEVEKDLDRLISTLSFLYHTREFRDEASFMVHNVLSDLTSEPKPLDPSEFPVREKTPVIWGSREIARVMRRMERASEQIKIGVGWLDLNKIHVAQLDIRACRSGQYELSDGARLDIECSLDVNISAYRTDTPPPGRSQQRERSNAKSLSEPRT